MNFRSDNEAPILEEIIKGISNANKDICDSYGDDKITKKLLKTFKKIFESDLNILPVATGTAANSIAISAMTPPYGTIFCSEHSHIDVDECGAPEFFSGGAKIKTIPSKSNKIDPGDFENILNKTGSHGIHETLPSVLSLTQATEYGTVYKIEEIKALSKIAHKKNIFVHMDGARFANAVASSHHSPAQLSCQAGVDILSLGATKGGAMAAECVLIFKSHLIDPLIRYRKRSGHLWSKHRYLSQQFISWFENDLWLNQARHSNSMAKLLESGLEKHQKIEIIYPVETNMVFAKMPESKIDTLEKAGARFYRWNNSSPNLIRLVCNWSTSYEDVNLFLSSL